MILEISYISKSSGMVNEDFVFRQLLRKNTNGFFIINQNKKKWKQLKK